MISECLSDINKPTDLHKQFEVHTKTPYPQILICEDKKRTQHNEDQLQHYLDNEEINHCGQVFNVRNLNDSGLLQAGYARNIDLDSELKRINHIDDKCYYDNYKTDPYDVQECNGLYENRNVLVKDYAPVGKDTNYEPSLGQRCDNGNPNDRNRFNWKKHKINGPNCLNKFGSFKECATPAPSPSSVRESLLQKTDNLPVYYNFNDDKYCADYPCQRVFNNFTKRSTIPNFHNLTDINPMFMSQKGILDNKNYSSIQ
jgi:hypothetical protein